MRLFLAVTLPDTVADHLDLALAAARRGPGGGDESVRWAARETWHLTAAFYGEAPDALAAVLADGLAAALEAVPCYRLSLRGAGVFAHRTLWVGVGGDVEAHRRLSDLAAQVGAGLGTGDDARERHRPHLTVGRARAGAHPQGRRPSGPRGTRDAGGPRTGVAAVAAALAVYAGPTWTVEEVQLVASRPGEGRGGGPRYTVLTRLPLAGEPH